jgi:hypothetical protein
MMTKGEAKIVETDVVIFPMEFGLNNQEPVLAKETATKVVTENPSVKTDVQIRFARLKKYLRKRSASIL